eukprot:1508086-Rhodomonas_salina.2
MLVARVKLPLLALNEAFCASTRSASTASAFCANTVICARKGPSLGQPRLVGLCSVSSCVRGINHAGYANDHLAAGFEAAVTAR